MAAEREREKDKVAVVGKGCSALLFLHRKICWKTFFIKVSQHKYVQNQMFRLINVSEIFKLIDIDTKCHFPKS